MPKLKPDTHRARRANILDAAEICFARNGFHRTTMHDICKEAGVSPGALYVYFGSKEDLIGGIVERDRSKLAGELAALADAPDLVEAISRLGEHYMIEEPQYKRVLCVEIGSESTRNPAVGELFRSVDKFCLESFVKLFDRASTDGKIAPSLDHRTIAQVLAIMGDGLFWRRALDPDFDAAKIIPVLMSIVSQLLNPIPAPAQTCKPDSETAR